MKLPKDILCCEVEGEKESEYMEYDAAGRLTYVEYHTGNATEFTYDRRDNIIRSTYSHNSEVIEQLQSEYDDENRMISMGLSGWGDGLKKISAIIFCSKTGWI